MTRSNKIILASAGAGKTTEIVKAALALRPKRTAITTFTLKNVGEIHSKIIELNNCIPPEISVYPWYTFVIHEMARPYQGVVHKERISSVHFAKGVTRTRVPKTNVAKYYFDSKNQIFSDRMGDFAILCEKESGGLVLKRLADMFDHVFIDEVQDFAGFDIDVVELLLKSSIDVTLVGDVRQSTFKTNHSPRNKPFCGMGFLKKIEFWQRQGLCEVKHLARSRRCIQPICNVADRIFPDLPPAQSENARVTGHDGVFVVAREHVDEYRRRYSPQLLRLNRKFGKELPAENFGAVKGLGFERVLIIPYSGITEWLKTGRESFVARSAEEVYVGITRAFQSAAFIHDDDVAVPGISRFDPNASI